MASHPPGNRPAREAPPAFCPQEPVAERLARMLVAVATELAVVRERLDTVERVLAARGGLEPGSLEAYVPDPDADAARQAWRQGYVERLFAELTAEAAASQRDKGR